ncbi:mechanosensitive ion channel [Isoptericola variabilis]|uniref:Conserved TM helix repeat-containing protein n=1 Tax=Isoptericola variabilis (strain 225) TaxID=743718 RepID=F6FW92_ISOV2|nr:mechanosensitive ion channel [Isoptericola variabilis]AEG45636.1 Conserved TM helix repeat-containing protein [Isoptericola variabilis 225]TWH25755.1 putative transporter (transmembrane protein) [Isoptericola variabilis J7]
MDIAESYDWPGILGKILIALLILVVTWIVARLVKWAITKLMARVRFLRREGADGREIGASIGQIAALLVWLFGLIAVLQVFQLNQVLGPIQGMLSTIMSYLPNIIGAAVVFFIGFLIAKIVKQILEAALGSVDFAGLFGRAKSAATRTTGTAEGTIDPATGEYTTTQTAAGDTRETNRRIVSVVANLVFAVILIVVAIAALQILGISAISDPAERMLTMILGAIPAIIAALLLLGLGYLIAKFVGDLLETTLQGVGVDRAVENLGVSTGRTSPSSIIAWIVKIAIMLFFAIMAAQALGFPAITDILNEVLELGGRVIFGAVIIAAGFFVANLLSRAVGSGTASTVLRYATIVLFVAMGLQYMGIADSIINLAFGAVVVGAALAAALAYGLGGRDVAARSLEKLERKVETTPSTPPTPPPPSTPPSTPPPAGPAV